MITAAMDIVSARTFQDDIEAVDVAVPAPGTVILPSDSIVLRLWTYLLYLYLLSGNPILSLVVSASVAGFRFFTYSKPVLIMLGIDLVLLWLYFHSLEIMIGGYW